MIGKLIRIDSRYSNPRASFAFLFVVGVVFLIGFQLGVDSPNVLFASQNKGSASNKPGASSAPGKRMTMTVSLSPQKVAIAEAFQVEIGLDTPSGAKVQFDEVPWNELGFYLSGETVDRVYPLNSERPMRRWTRLYQLEVYEAGEKELPRFRAEVSLDELGEAMVIESGPNSILIEGMIGAEADFEAFKDLKSVPLAGEGQGGLLRFWLAAAFVGLLGVAIIYRVRKFRKPSARAVAIRQIELWLQDLNESVSRSSGTERLSHIFKEYVSASFGVNAASKTRSELIGELTRQAAPGDTIRKLDAFLQEVDRSRFAGAPEVGISRPDDPVRDLTDASKLVGELIDELSRWQARQDKEGG